MRTDNVKAAIVLLSLIAMPIGAYVGGYFLCSGPGGCADRLFAARWQYEMYQPAVRIEQLVTGRQIVAGYRTLPGQ